MRSATVGKNGGHRAVGLGVTTDSSAPTDSAGLALTMYTTSWCGYCNRLKVGLKSLGVAWDEIDIEADSAAADFVGSVNGGNHVVPTVKFADGSTATNPSIADVKKKLGL